MVGHFRWKTMEGRRGAEEAKIANESITIEAALDHFGDLLRYRKIKNRNMQMVNGGDVKTELQTLCKNTP